MLAQRWARRTAIAVLPFTLFASLGCYGKFPITFAIYKWNGKITSYGFVHSLIMWILLIIPVYWIAFLVDFIIFNFVEFWFDVSPDLVVDRTLADGRLVHMESTPDRSSMHVTITRDGVIVQEERHLRQPDGSVEIYDGAGAYLGSVRVLGDKAEIIDRDGRVRGTIDRPAVAR